MKRFWQRWSYWDFEDKLVWVLKRIVTLLALSVLVAVVVGLIYLLVIVYHFFIAEHHPDEFVHWLGGAFLLAMNYYMLDDLLWG